ncbi:phosphoribosylformylglycinamidine synthase subunit PurL [Helicobacter trogontum]|uniref:phosphoribosylformylglycinamidine synthase subunit PurL n=1 Tax=Helicobacter trogontum TaxID=50960 RepID=UPI000CF0E50A|nr:phosphoribosylformylglycinamidine synthase subunit PurL [Helicobacter trogontum]
MGEWSIKQEHLNAVLKKHKLDSNDYEKITAILEREPNLIELGIFSAMWSEHCSYKSSRIYLKGFPTEASWVLQGPGENAGVIDIGDNLAAVFKIESHNHPSFIEPNAGAATGVGGILRDIFTMGANPIINLNSIRFGNIIDSKMKKKHIHLLHGVVEGIGHYGNCMGIPTIGGETSFESCYNGNILVNAFSLGIAKQDEIFYGKASGEGNPIMYVGSKTGRDGLGGAVMSSDSFDSTSKALRPTVQIGDPFVEKSLLEACLEVFQKDLIVGIQDMGAAGLTSSSFEMASRSGSGMIMWLDKIPMRESGMTPYELMLSESQERMLLCAKRGAEEEIRTIFAKYELSAEIVGEVRNTGKMELFWHGDMCATLPIAPIVENAPMLNRPTQKPKYLESCSMLDLKITNKFLQDQLNTKDIDIMQCDSANLNILTREILKSLDICDKSWIYNQYDDSIKASTIKGAGMLSSSIVALHNYNSKKAIAVSVKCNVRYCYLDPKIGAKIAVAQAGRDVALSGAKPLAITDCLNFGSPENPEVMWQFKESCEGIKEACKTLQTPVVSGNVSLYNQTNDEAIYPTPSIVCVGLLEDSNKAISSHFIARDSYICVLGVVNRELCLSGSILQKVVGAKNSGVLHDINLESELKLWETLRESVTQGHIISAKDIAQGGFVTALCKMAVVGKVSVEVLTDAIQATLAKDFANYENLMKDSRDYMSIFSHSPSSKLMLFSENHTQVICETPNIESAQALSILAKRNGLSLCVIGKVTHKYTQITDITSNDCIKINDIAISLQEAYSLYYKSFETYL